MFSFEQEKFTALGKTATCWPGPHLFVVVGLLAREESGDGALDECHEKLRRGGWRAAGEEQCHEELRGARGRLAGVERLDESVSGGDELLASVTAVVVSSVRSEPDRDRPLLAATGVVAGWYVEACDGGLCSPGGGMQMG